MSNYLHGFDSEEQQRLLDQAGFLAQKIYAGIDFSGCKNLLEIGSGVGAQTAVLLDLYPDLHITCVDFSESQLQTAKQNLKGKESRVTFVQQDAQALSLPDKFDSVFICWALEHIPSPIKVLEHLKAHLTVGAKIYITEVFNSTFYCFPFSPGLEKYYQAYNEFQEKSGGNPDVGSQLGNLLNQAGFSSISTWNQGFFLDQSAPEQLKSMLDFWKKLLLSGAPALLQAGLISQNEVQAMEREIDLIGQNKNAVFFYQFVQAFATL
ncbi:methyltransferase family protein [Algoriphagus boseongensis]|uniref:Methyltransferase family protein n=1 Tax=Algoriphagus boseongensis TaxID=1442587 RepID=A0A4V3D1R7_9BACT|nr:class I SAM-dependent methyltransferase [Algoriphagus boseongensis]TDQ12942.1 methyltransferase family protein [Algoriphagus boseongensis]